MDGDDHFQIIVARTKIDFDQARSLFKEYAASLYFDLGFQGFEKELEIIDQQYCPPKGALLLCLDKEAQAIGCVGVRELSDGVAELKRLYVKPSFRHLRIGKELLSLAIAESTRLGYRFIRLDTVPGQEKAHALYAGFGFYKIEPYRHNPVDGTLYMEKKLLD